MINPSQLVQKYLKGFYAGDATVRDLLTDDFHFSGPAAHFHGANAFLKAAGHAAAGTRSIEIEKLFANGDDVAAFYVLHLDHRVSDVRVAERFHLQGDRIAASTLIMDTAPFLSGTDRGATQKATDPVCHMAVEVSAAAATQVHDGITYYFCSVGCAEAFALAPEKYLS